MRNTSTLLLPFYGLFMIESNESEEYEIKAAVLISCCTFNKLELITIIAFITRLGPLSFYFSSFRVLQVLSEFCVFCVFCELNVLSELLDYK